MYNAKNVVGKCTQRKSCLKMYGLGKILQHKVQRKYRLFATAVKYMYGFIVEKKEILVHAKKYPSKAHSIKIC